MKNNKLVKVRKSKRVFAEILTDKLSQLGKIDAQINVHKELDSGWVNIYLDDVHYISFWLIDKGNRIDRITIHKNIIGVIDTKQICATQTPLKK